MSSNPRDISSIMEFSANHMENLRENKINDIWNKIHGKYKSVFYWMNDTKTEYHYDIDKDAIVSDNGFSVPVSFPTEQITKDCIFNLIEQLEGDIAEYYLNHYKIVL